MKLYSINFINQEMESMEIIKETPKQYHLKKWHGGRIRRVSKDDPMIAFSPRAAYAKFESKQLGEIERLKKRILYLDETIDKASDAWEAYIDSQKEIDQ